MRMASLSSSPALLAAAFFLALLSSANASSGRLHNVNHATSVSISDNLCKKVEHPELCHSLLNEHKFTSPMDLTIFTIKKTIVQVNKGIETVKAHLDKDENGIIAACTEMYGSAVEELEKVLGELQKSGNQGDVMSDASAVITYLETCKDGFVDAEKEFIFEDLNNKLENMASNVLSLAKIVTNS